MSEKTNLIYPLTFRPIFKDYVWGGRNLETRLGRALPDGIVAESWEIAAHPNGSSVVACGPLAGQTLQQVQDQLGEALVGVRNRYALAQERFPLLIKLLDANRWLSVQVHPDDAYGLAHEGEFGKTEMWVVLEAEPGAEIIYGFKAGVNRDSFAAALAAGTVEETLHRLPVATGDVVFVPAGSIHALGPGIIVAEIQQNSDTTYRIYDWGRPRPIHVAQALEVLNFAQIEPGPVTPTVMASAEGVQSGLRRELIGHCQYFQTERITLSAGEKYSGRCAGGSFEIWGALSGGFQVAWAGDPVTVTGVGWVLLPATLGNFQIVAQAESTLLRIVTP